MDRDDLIQAVIDQFKATINSVRAKNILENDPDIHKAIEDPDPEDDVSEEELDNCVEAVADALQTTLESLRESVEF